MILKNSNRWRIIVHMMDKKEKKEEMSIDDLAVMMQAGFSGIEERLGGQIKKLDSRMDGLDSRMDGLETRMGSLEKRMDSLELRMFTDEEKEEILAMVRHYDQRLETETLGKNFITLTREEYNIFVKIAGIPNRFEVADKEYA